MNTQELINILQKKLLEADNAREQVLECENELRKVNKKLAESEALKSHFISNITNEIVNPFSSILGLSKSIIAMKEADFPKVRAMAELIHSEAFDLDFQLKNIFTAARIEAGEAQPEYIKSDINLVITSVINSYRYKAEQKQLKINFSLELDQNLKDSVYFNTDPEKLRLIIANLLSNGIKYSNAANRIEVKGSVENKKLIVSVKDFGIGIAKNDLEVIFDRFKRLDTTINSLNPGHGLGLSVTKALLDAMNGEIDIASKRNIGSVFTITIPEGDTVDSSGFALDGNEFIFDGGDDTIF